MRLAPNDGDDQRQPQHAGPHERRRRSPDPDTDRQRVLHGPRIDALAGERGAIFSLPLDMCLLANLKKQFEFFGKELIVVVQIETEERVGLNE